jgi:hypothetical protein
MAIISPGLGEFEEVGKQLFALATDRTERRSVLLVQEGPAGTSYEVPDDLHDRWLEEFGPKRQPTIPTSSEPATLRRRPGRPPRNPLPEQE